LAYISTAESIGVSLATFT